VSGKYSRDKGAGGERELAKLLGAEKISGYMKPGNDLEWRGRQIEVKRRSGWPSVMLENWRRDAQIVMFRVDREDWMVYLPLTELLDLLDVIMATHSSTTKQCHPTNNGNVSGRWLRRDSPNTAKAPR